MNNAEIHAKIAEKVWPDCRYMEPLPEDTPVWIEDKLILHKWNGNRYVRANFNLLETDSNGEPTMQAKASALDVLVWYRMNGGYDYFKGCGYGFIEASNMLLNKLTDILKSSNPCEAIFNAAKEALDES